MSGTRTSGQSFMATTIVFPATRSHVSFGRSRFRLANAVRWLRPNPSYFSLHNCASHQCRGWRSVGCRFWMQKNSISSVWPDLVSNLIAWNCFIYCWPSWVAKLPSAARREPSCWAKLSKIESKKDFSHHFSHYSCLQAISICLRESGLRLAWLTEIDF